MKGAAPILLGLAAAAALTAEAEGCSLVPRVPEHQPYFPHLVMSSHSIDLVRVVSVEAFESGDSVDVLRPVGRNQPRTHRAVFRSLERIKGDGEEQFSFEFSAPYRDEFIENSPPDRFRAENNDRNGHRNASFWTEIDIFDVPVGADCSQIYPIFLPGEDYLVFRDESGTPISLYDSFGVNFERIGSRRDAWLEAVEALAGNPDQQYAWQMPVSEFVRLFHVMGLVTISDCDDGISIAQLEPVGEPFQPVDFDIDPADEDPTAQYWSADIFNDSQTICRSGEDWWRSCSRASNQCEIEQRYVVFPLETFESINGPGATHFGILSMEVTPDDRVDFTNSEFEIQLTGDLQPTLSEVISWFESSQ